MLVVTDVDRVLFDMERLLDDIALELEKMGLNAEPVRKRELRDLEFIEKFYGEKARELVRRFVNSFERYTNKEYVELLRELSRKGNEIFVLTGGFRYQYEKCLPLRDFVSAIIIVRSSREKLPLLARLRGEVVVIDDSEMVIKWCREHGIKSFWIGWYTGKGEVKSVEELRRVLLEG